MRSPKLSRLNVLQENQVAVAGLLDNHRRKAGHPQTCWRCQKEKLLKGGSIKMLGPGLRRFLCADCLAEMANKYPKA